MLLHDVIEVTVKVSQIRHSIFVTFNSLSPIFNRNHRVLTCAKK